MRPFKAGHPFATWMMRLTVGGLIFFTSYQKLWPANLVSISYYITLGLSLSALGLIIGGLLSKPNLTILSGLILSLVCVYQIIVNFTPTINISLLQLSVWFAVGFYFVCNGNK